VTLLDSPRLEDAEGHWPGEDFEMIRRFDPSLHRKGTLGHVRSVMLQWGQARAAGGPMFVYAIRELRKTAHMTRPITRGSQVPSVTRK
jgi:hypothetical protein